MSRVERNTRDYIPEPEVLAEWPMLSHSELRRARKRQDISFFSFPAGPHYLEADVQAYLDRKYRKCAAEPTNPSQTGGPIMAITSTNHIPIGEDSGTPAGMTPGAESFAAEVFAQAILTRPRNSSSSSPARRRSKPKMLQGRAAL